MFIMQTVILAHGRMMASHGHTVCSLTDVSMAECSQLREALQPYNYFMLFVDGNLLCQRSRKDSLIGGGGHSLKLHIE